MPALIPIQQLERLRRENWQGESGSTRLSQELYALLGADLPIESSTPVTLTQTDPTKPVFTVIPSTLPGAVPATNVGGGGGGLDPADVEFPTAPNPTGLGSNFPVVLYGVVVSGTGTTYVVTCWMLSPATSSLGNYNCDVPGIDPAEQIPPSTPGLVWCSLNSTLQVTKMLFFPIALFQAP